VAPTGSGKTTALITKGDREKTTAVLAPFTSITEQVYLANPDFELKVGMKDTGEISFSNGRIVSFHSAARLLEMENIDRLIIDEFHYLINYAGFASTMLIGFFSILKQLWQKFPDMITIALTGTPHFVRKASFLDINLIVVEQRFPTAKPSAILIGSTWTKHYERDKIMLCLYPSRKNGLAWANKYNGVFIDSANKDSSEAFAAIVRGEMPAKKVFTSTLLSTGVSINEPVDEVITNWLDLADIAQISARPRQGDHLLKVTRIPKPYFQQTEPNKPKLNFTNDYARNFEILKAYSDWYSWTAHQDEGILSAVIHEMIFKPEWELEEF